MLPSLDVYKLSLTSDESSFSDSRLWGVIYINTNSINKIMLIRFCKNSEYYQVTSH